MKLEPGDVIVIRIAQAQYHKMRQQFYDLAAETWPGHRCIVLEDCYKIEVVSESAAPKEVQEAVLAERRTLSIRDLENIKKGLTARVAEKGRGKLVAVIDKGGDVPAPNELQSSITISPVQWTDKNEAELNEAYYKAVGSWQAAARSEADEAFHDVNPDATIDA